MVGRPKWMDDAPLRVAPNTVVIWFDGMARKTGRVLHNLPSVGRKPGALVIRTADGERIVLSVDKVSIGPLESTQ